jgi:thiamine pyrophosphokinase
MYNTDFTCIYQNEKDEAMSEFLYKVDYLHIFQYDDFDLYEKEINSCIREMYQKIKASSYSKDFYKCMVLAAKRFFSEDVELGFMVLFSYDLLYLTHPCIVDFLKDGCMQQQNVAKLLEKIHNIS